jgi:hypothetical protein
MAYPESQAVATAKSVTAPTRGRVRILNPPRAANTESSEFCARDATLIPQERDISAES